MGNGKFVETMLRHNILPSGMDPQKPYLTYNSPSRGLASPIGYEALPSALAFHRRVSTLAAEFGLLARDIRAEEKHDPNDRSDATIQGWHERIGVLQDTLRRAWTVQIPASIASGYCNENVPVDARGVFEHVSGFFSSPFGRLQSRGRGNFSGLARRTCMTLVPFEAFQVCKSSESLQMQQSRLTTAQRMLADRLLHCTVIRALPRLLNLLSHIHVQRTTSLIAIILHQRSLSMWKRDRTTGQRNRLPQPCGAQVHRLPLVHVWLRCHDAKRAHGDPRPDEEDGRG